jgi:hypothetical protein
MKDTPWRVSHVSNLSLFWESWTIHRKEYVTKTIMLIETHSLNAFRVTKTEFLELFTNCSHSSPIHPSWEFLKLNNHIIHFRHHQNCCHMRKTWRDVQRKTHTMTTTQWYPMQSEWLMMFRWTEFRECSDYIHKIRSNTATHRTVAVMGIQYTQHFLCFRAEDNLLQSRFSMNDNMRRLRRRRRRRRRRSPLSWRLECDVAKWIINLEKQFSCEFRTSQLDVRANRLLGVEDLWE